MRSFQSTFSVRRATAEMHWPNRFQCISIHVLREESDSGEQDGSFGYFISIHVLREESDGLLKPQIVRCLISIHVLREESDIPWQSCSHRNHISIHVLREESDPRTVSRSPTKIPFQSTFSVRRATGLPDGHGGGIDISIHVLREESDLCASLKYARATFQSTFSVRRATLCCSQSKIDAQISIHVLREESDYRGCRIARNPRYFNPRSP